MASTSGRELLQRFYAAFASGDPDGMAASYSPVAHFSDPVFPALDGADIGGMWRMLLGRASDLSVEIEELTADDRHGSATWTARYRLAGSGRQVNNRVRSRFDLGRGVILAQHDSFDFHAWSAQALGLRGRLLGWTPFLRSAVRRQAAEQLREFRAAEGTRPPSA
jgi:ketosteroid isomerase-like protein